MNTINKNNKDSKVHFIGREQELSFFRQQLVRTSSPYRIFYITGQNGIGKTTLLGLYKQIAKKLGFLVVECNEQERGVLAVLEHFARQLANQGSPLKQFDAYYQLYRRKIDEIGSDTKAPQGLGMLLKRTLWRSMYMSGGLKSDSSKGLEYLPQSLRETKTREWSSYLTTALKNKEEQDLLQEPVKVLTPIFFKDLNAVADMRGALLCFENFEETRDDLQQWLLGLEGYKLSKDIRIAIASRNPPGLAWEPLQDITKSMALDLFTTEEAEKFLTVYGIDHIERRSEILKLSSRLPVLMSWMVASKDKRPDLSLPARNIVERFLRWISDPKLRLIVLSAAVPRTFDRSIIRLLLGDDDQSFQDSSVLEWLKTLPFVEDSSDGWSYHLVIRRLLLHYQRRQIPEIYRQRHKKLAEFYDKKRRALGLSKQDRWGHSLWRKETLTYLYHFLAADPQKHWVEVMKVFAEAVYEHSGFSLEITELLSLDDTRDELIDEHNTLLKLFRQKLQNIEEGSLHEVLGMVSGLENTIDVLLPPSRAETIDESKEYLIPESKREEALREFEQVVDRDTKNALAIASRGEIFRLMGQYEAALADFAQAIELDPHNVWTIASEGETYRLMELYGAALADFSLAIDLDLTYIWAIAHRGKTYQLMGQYEEALADFNNAIELDRKYAWAIAQRGETYRLMGKYEEALSDFYEAIEAGEENSWTFSRRGDVYRLMRQYQTALLDFNQAINLNPKDFWAIGHRGVLYLQMGKLEEALTDFNHAIDLNPEDTWAMAFRGLTYRQMNRYEEALVDFTRSLELDGTNAWAMARRGETYRRLGRYETALNDFDRAIELDEKDGWTFVRRGFVRGQMARYEEALGDFTRAIELDEKNTLAIASRGETYYQLKQYEKALSDFSRVVESDKKDPWALIRRGQTYRQLNQFEEAIADFDRAVKLNPEDIRAISSRGQAYFRMKRYEMALADFNHILELNPGDATSLTRRGEIYLQIKQYKAALADFDRAIELNPKDARNFARRGEIRRQLREYETALADFNRSIELDPKDAWNFAHRGETYRQTGQYEMALVDFNQAIALNPKHAWAIDHRGRTHQQMGRRAEALADARQLINLRKDSLVLGQDETDN
jgi:tetratricopeptide (TPR) repeat protein